MVVTCAGEAQAQSAVVPFAEALIRFETNATDGDAGIQIFLDAEPYNRIRVSAPTGVIVDLLNRGALRNFGLTELFTESNEPPFDEVPLADVLARFPEGRYVFSGRTIEGKRLRSVAFLTHNIPEGPVILAPLEGEVLDIDDVEISFAPVTTSLEDPGAPVRPITISGYEVVIDSETEPSRRLDLFLEPDVTHVEVPEEFLQPGTDYSFEVLAIEESGNQTITGSSFSVR